MALELLDPVPEGPVGLGELQGLLVLRGHPLLALFQSIGLLLQFRLEPLRLLPKGLDFIQKPLFRRGRRLLFLLFLLEGFADDTGRLLLGALGFQLVPGGQQHGFELVQEPRRFGGGGVHRRPEGLELRVEFGRGDLGRERLVAPFQVGGGGHHRRSRRSVIVGELLAHHRRLPVQPIHGGFELGADQLVLQLRVSVPEDLDLELFDELFEGLFLLRGDDRSIRRRRQYRFGVAAAIGVLWGCRRVFLLLLLLLPLLLRLVQLRFQLRQAFRELGVVVLGLLQNNGQAREGRFHLEVPGVELLALVVALLGLAQAVLFRQGVALLLQCGVLELQFLVEGLEGLVLLLRDHQRGGDVSGLGRHPRRRLLRGGRRKEGRPPSEGGPNR
mmetsp:Transcript_19053/g.44231  ORF Transcript_19053/g.44231 Transcript_19053/m.44231 type:complete len:386 (+) Transcript_19053:871-2028(+)